MRITELRLDPGDYLQIRTLEGHDILIGYDYRGGRFTVSDQRMARREEGGNWKAGENARTLALDVHAGWQVQHYCGSGEWRWTPLSSIMEKVKADA